MKIGEVPHVPRGQWATDPKGVIEQLRAPCDDPECRNPKDRPRMRNDCICVVRLTAQALDELERMRHYADTCGGADNDGRCPHKHLMLGAGKQGENDASK